MDINLSPKTRQLIYIVVVMGTSVIVPLHQFHVVSDLVMAVWSGFSGSASLLAAFNVNNKGV